MMAMMAVCDDPGLRPAGDRGDAGAYFGVQPLASEAWYFPLETSPIRLGTKRVGPLHVRVCESAVWIEARKLHVTRGHGARQNVCSFPYRHAKSHSKASLQAFSDLGSPLRTYAGHCPPAGLLRKPEGRVGADRMPQNPEMMFGISAKDKNDVSHLSVQHNQSKKKPTSKP